VNSKLFSRWILRLTGPRKSSCKPAPQDQRVKLLRFSRRIGQPKATLGGLHYSSGQAVIVMDVDLQDPPELIPAMISRWQEGFDVVYAQRRNREGEEHG